MPTNTPDEIEFFQALGGENIERVRALAARMPSLLNSHYYKGFGATPLTLACFHNHPRLVAVLIELGADPNRKSDWEMGPWSPLHCAIYQRNKELAEYLLNHGAVIDLHTAAGLGRTAELARMLDSEPARVAEPGGDGCQPLHFADSIEVAQLLIERGADLDARCIDHYSTPAQYLCSCRPDVARFLFYKGAKPDIFSAILCADDQLVDSLLQAQPDLISARINQSFFPPGNGFDVHNILTFTVGQDLTPLHTAAKANRAESIGLLVTHGAEPNIRGGYDQGTPLHTAAWNNCDVSARALLEHKADIEARSGPLHNNTPAGWAIVAGADRVFDLLLDQGAICHPWFLDDARDACAGRFQQVSRASTEQRQHILNRLMRS